MLELLLVAVAFAFLAAVPTGIPAAGVLAALVAAGRLDPSVAVPVCAAAAVGGRALLMLLAARGARVLPRSAAANLIYARRLLDGRRRVWWAAALLAVPLFPALQVMVVASSAGVRRLPLLVGYGAGRLLTYALAAAAAGAGTAAVSRVAHTGPLRIALSLAFCATPLLLVARVDWQLLVVRRRLRLLRRPPSATRA